MVSCLNKKMKLVFIWPNWTERIIFGHTNQRDSVYLHRSLPSPKFHIFQETLFVQPNALLNFQPNWIKNSFCYSTRFWLWLMLLNWVFRFAVQKGHFLGWENSEWSSVSVINWIDFDLFAREFSSEAIFFGSNPPPNTDQKHSTSVGIGARSGVRNLWYSSRRRRDSEWFGNSL